MHNFKITIAKLPYKIVELDNGISIYVGGRSLRLLEKESFQKNPFPIDFLLEFLKNQKQHFFIIVVSQSELFFAVDRISSYPLYYSVADSSIIVSDCIADKIIDCDPSVILELVSSGYVAQDKTLSKTWKRLEAGCYFHSKNNEITVKNYYSYFPQPKLNQLSRSDWIDYLDATFNNVIDRMIDTVAGRRIVLPLSSGIDSRLLLAKIKQRGYKNMLAITYGTKHFFEIDLAKSSAAMDQVEWKFIEIDTKQSAHYFNSTTRLDYAHWASSYSVIPGYMEYQAFISLYENGALNKDDVIINGQTGDFISGAHIPKILFEKEHTQLFVDQYIKKHHGMWNNLNPESHAFLSNLIQSYADEGSNLKGLNEHIEWKERQSKLVMRGQRLYDYLGMDWLLPYWDSAYMDFWEQVPFELKYQQNLLIEYLNKIFPQHFKELRGIAHIWQGKYKAVPYIAQLVGLLKGKEAKHSFYKKMSYYDGYHYQYALFGKELYKKYWPYIRNAGSMIVVSYFNDLGLNIDQYLAEFYDNMFIFKKAS